MGRRDQAAWARVVKGRCPLSVAPKAGTETLDAISQALAYRDGQLLAFQAMMSLRLGEFTLEKIVSGPASLARVGRSPPRDDFVPARIPARIISCRLAAGRFSAMVG